MIWGRTEGRRLKSAIAEAGTSQEKLASLIGVSVPTMRRFVGGQDPGEDRLHAMMAHLGMPVTRVIGREEESRFDEIDVYDVDVAAGPGRLPLSEEPVDSWPFPRDWLSRHTSPGSKLAMVRVLGDSQYPDFRSGDMVVIDLADNRLRDGLAVIRRDDRLMLKRLVVEGGAVRLTSANPSYPDIPVPINEEGFVVIGMAAMAIKLL